MSKTPHIAAVVQARMRSTRLPGKVLKDVVGRPLLWHILHRLRKSELIQTICVATTTDPADNAIADYAKAQDVQVVRGSEDDVLARFALAAHYVDPDVVVRVNADAPLVDAGFVDYLIREMLRAQADFVVLKPGLFAIHDGADPMSRWALDKLVLMAHADPVAREHVSAYFKLHPEFVKVAHIDLPTKWHFKGARLSIDTPADVTFIETIYERLHAQAGEATLTDLVALLNREPALLELNRHVQQKPVTAQSGTLIMRCDGGGAIGLGHVRRSLSLARRLRDAHGFGVHFAMNGDRMVNEMVAAEGFAVDVKPHGDDECEWLLGLVDAHAAPGVVLDVRTNLSATSVMRLRGAGAIVGVIDDASQRRLCADFAVYPPVPQVFSLNWEGAESEPLVGWEWVILGQELGLPLRQAKSKPHVLISMGGTDPLGLTLPTVEALATLEPSFNVTVVLGPGAPPHLEHEIATVAPRFEILRAPNDLPRLMAEADLGVISFGVTAYELAALGVPALYLCLTPDHALSASAFEAAGMGISLGLAGGASDMMIAGAVQSLLADAPRRRAMAAAGRMNLDGRGASRVAERMARLIEEQRAMMAEVPMPKLREAV